MKPEYENKLKELEEVAYKSLDLCANLPVADANLLLNRIREIVAAMSKLANLSARAKLILRLAVSDELKTVDPKTSATERKLLLEGSCSFAYFVSELLDQTDRALSKALDGCRSSLSYLKTEMENLPYQEG